MYQTHTCWLSDVLFSSCQPLIIPPLLPDYLMSGTQQLSFVDCVKFYANHFRRFEVYDAKISVAEE